MINLALRQINHRLSKPTTLDDFILNERNLKSFGSEHLCMKSEIRQLFVGYSVNTFVQQLLSETTLPVEDIHIALRFPSETNESAKNGGWHIDNVTEEGGIRNCALVVGIYLSDALTENAGNLTVFPGTHHIMEEEFRNLGYDAIYKKEGNFVRPKIPLPTARHLKTRLGDSVIMHPLLIHFVGKNCSPNIRYAIYYRLYFSSLPPLFRPFNSEERLRRLQNMWEGYQVVL